MVDERKKTLLNWLELVRIVIAALAGWLGGSV